MISPQNIFVICPEGVQIDINAKLSILIPKTQFVSSRTNLSFNKILNMRFDCSQDITRFNHKIRLIEYQQNTQKVIKE